MHIEEVSYSDGNINCIGFCATPDKDKKLPLVLISHAWAGRDDFAMEMAKKMASWGYVGFALDNYGEKRVGASKEENSSLMTPFMENRGMLLNRLKAGLEAAKGLPYTDENKISAIGFCFGGLCVLDMARNNLVNSITSFHGLLNPSDLTSNNIETKILVLHGQDDPMVDPQKVTNFIEEMDNTNADWQLHSFGKTVHAFTNPNANDPAFGTVYHELNCKRSFSILKSFLIETFV